MSVAPPPAAHPPTRWGLAAKLFGALLLLGALAVLVSGALGYLRAREALQASIYNQLNSARQTKARQVDFKATTQAATKMQIDRHAAEVAARTAKDKGTAAE